MHPPPILIGLAEADQGGWGHAGRNETEPGDPRLPTREEDILHEPCALARIVEVEPPAVAEPAAPVDADQRTLPVGRAVDRFHVDDEAAAREPDSR